MASSAGGPAPVAERWAYGRWGQLLVSLFIAYHAIAMSVQLFPADGLTGPMRRWVGEHLVVRGYLHMTASTQTWRMFAPTPHRRNIFVRVLVSDDEGRLWDLGHDAHSTRRYPYLFYDRMGKINRRLAEPAGAFHRVYAAWVCRDWELSRLREPADVRRRPAARVHLVKLWTQIPPPRKAIATFGYDPRRLRPHEDLIVSFRCSEIPHGQVPNVLRTRYGLPRIDERAEFRDIPVRTWRARRRGRRAPVEEARAWNEDDTGGDTDREGGE